MERCLVEIQEPIPNLNGGQSKLPDPPLPASRNLSQFASRSSQVGGIRSSSQLLPKTTQLLPKDNSQALTTPQYNPSSQFTSLSVSSNTSSPSSTFNNLPSQAQQSQNSYLPSTSSCFPYNNNPTINNPSTNLFNTTNNVNTLSSFRSTNTSSSSNSSVYTLQKNNSYYSSQTSLSSLPSLTINNGGVNSYSGSNNTNNTNSFSNNYNSNNNSNNGSSTNSNKEIILPTASSLPFSVPFVLFPPNPSSFLQGGNNDSQNSSYRNNYLNEFSPQSSHTQALIGMPDDINNNKEATSSTSSSSSSSVSDSNSLSASLATESEKWAHEISQKLVSLNEKDKDFYSARKQVIASLGKQTHSDADILSSLVT